MKTYEQLTEEQQEKVVDSLYASEVQNIDQHMEAKAVPLSDLLNILDGFDDHDTQKVTDALREYPLSADNPQAYDATGVILIIDGHHIDLVVDAVPYDNTHFTKDKAITRAITLQDNYLSEEVNHYLETCGAYIYDNEVQHLVESGELSL